MGTQPTGSHGASSALPLLTLKAGVFGIAQGRAPLPPPSPRQCRQGGENSAICVSTPRASAVHSVATREANSSPRLPGSVVLEKARGCSCLLHRSPVQGTRLRPPWVPPRVPDGEMVNDAAAAAAAALDAAAAAAWGSPRQRPGFDPHPGTGPRVAR